jgi:hypothetical protein
VRRLIQLAALMLFKRALDQVLHIHDGSISRDQRRPKA